jgi:prepilin-type N-terminal cleavage/methylation domain-containing protein
MKKRHAFTLVELLVVIAIIAVLLAILMPSLTGAKALAKRLQCAKKLSGVGRAFGMYTDQYNGLLPLLETYKKSPTAKATDPFTACTETPALLGKRGIPDDGKYYWRHLGCLFGVGFIDDGKVLYCPAVTGWEDDYKSQVKTGSDNQTTFANLTYNWNQGPRANRGYCYWPLTKAVAKQVNLDGMTSTGRTRYKVGMPYGATMINELNMTRPIAADVQFHSTKMSGWLIDCLYPDGHVIYQKQPKMAGKNYDGADGVWGMYSDEENCQFNDDIINKTKPITLKDPTEKGLNLDHPVTPTEFAYALEQ